VPVSPFWLPLSVVLRVEPHAAALGVFDAARSPRGFVRAYEAAGDRAALGEHRVPGRTTPWPVWRDRFAALHLRRGEALWAQGKPTRRHLALALWAHSPTPTRLGRWLDKQAIGALARDLVLNEAEVGVKASEPADPWASLLALYPASVRGAMAEALQGAERAPEGNGVGPPSWPRVVRLLGYRGMTSEALALEAGVPVELVQRAHDTARAESASAPAAQSRLYEYLCGGPWAENPCLGPVRTFSGWYGWRPGIRARYVRPPVTRAEAHLLAAGEYAGQWLPLSTQNASGNGPSVSAVQNTVLGEVLAATAFLAVARP
jgi:hypothetical protein